MSQSHLQNLTKECFSALSRIRELPTHNLPSPDVLQTKLRVSIDTMSANATQMGVPREDVYDITYAIVAHADKIALNASYNIRNYWMQQPLQFQYFQETNAGQGFFTRLQAVRSDPRRIEVLRIFYLCLLFGFQGSHRVRGGEIQLMNLTEELRYEIARTEPRVELLSSSSQRPEESISRRRGGFPMAFAGICVLLISIGAWFGFRSILESDIEELDEKVEALMTPTLQAPAVKPTPAAPVPKQPATPGDEFGGDSRQ